MSKTTDKGEDRDDLEGHDDEADSEEETDEEGHEDDARDEDDGDDEGDEEEAAPSAPARGRARAHRPHDDHDHGHDDHAHGDAESPDGDEDPSWWAPHAVLGLIVMVGLLGFFGVFNKSLAFLAAHPANAAEPATETKEAATPTPPTPQPAQPSRPPTQMPQQAREMFGAKHLLVMYKGSRRAPASITRTKEEAKARAQEAAKKAKSGKFKFEDLVKEYTDEPGGGQRGGDLGTFPKGAMVPEFQAGLEKLKVGETSDIVETPFGYHVILRTK